MRKSQASDSSKPTPKQKPRLAAITGFAQRAGAAMFQASFDTCSGVASMKALDVAAAGEVLADRAQHDDAHARILVERLEHQAQAGRAAASR